MRTPSRFVAAIALAGCALLLAACQRHDTDRSSALDKPTAGGVGSSSTASAVGASGVAAPYVAIVPADAQPPAAAASGGNGSGTATAGAETSSSPSMGPGNGSTAVGGQAGGQAAGGSRGGTPAKTGGDGH